MSHQSPTKIARTALVTFVISLVSLVALPAATAHAACTPTTDYGSATLTMSVPSTGTYRIWSRIMAPDSTNNSFNLEIDGGSCILVGNNDSMPANAWTWVDYKDGNTNTKIDVDLASGTHTFKLIGAEPSVFVDRLIVTSDTTCVPTPADGTGDNCVAVADSTPPTSSITTPTDGQTVKGKTVSISATAADNSGTVSQVEFYINGSLTASDTTDPYGITWDTTLVTDGAYQLTSRAYDGAGNVVTSPPVNVTVSNAAAGTPPDTTKPTVNITAPASNGSVSGTIQFAATANDESGVAKVDLAIDGATKASPSIQPYALPIDTTSLSNGSHTLSATATDTAGNTQTTSITITVANPVPAPPDTTKPTVTLSSPANNASLNNSSATVVTANATDDTAVAKIEFYLDASLKATDTSPPYTATVNTAVIANGTHTITAKAFDDAGNTSSSTVTIMVNNTTATSTGSGVGGSTSGSTSSSSSSSSNTSSSTPTSTTSTTSTTPTQSTTDTTTPTTTDGVTVAQTSPYAVDALPDTSGTPTSSKKVSGAAVAGISVLVLAAAAIGAMFVIRTIQSRRQDTAAYTDFSQDLSEGLYPTNNADSPSQDENPNGYGDFTHRN